MKVENSEAGDPTRQGELNATFWNNPVEIEIAIEIEKIRMRPPPDTEVLKSISIPIAISIPKKPNPSKRMRWTLAPRASDPKSYGAKKPGTSNTHGEC